MVFGPPPSENRLYPVTLQVGSDATVPKPAA